MFRCSYKLSGLFLTGILVLLAAISTPASASIEGTYSGNFITGVQGGGAYSYVHESNSGKKSGDAGYTQYAGGSVIFAMDASDIISLTVEDVGMDGFGVGDKINLDLEVNLFKFDGSLNSSNDLTSVVGTLKLNGTLTVGGLSHSPSFSEGIYNITAADQGVGFAGMDYEIEVVDDFSINSNNYSAGDVFSGDAFFQSGNLAGPFNGISYNNATKSISFAIWGDSRNMDDSGAPNNTGTYTPAGSSADASPLGFDIYIEAQLVPEASSILVWSVLCGLGLSFRRRSADRTAQLA